MEILFGFDLGLLFDEEERGRVGLEKRGDEEDDEDEDEDDEVDDEWCNGGVGGGGGGEGVVIVSPSFNRGGKINVSFLDRMRRRKRNRSEEDADGV